ncbi:MAG: GntR family transcriptional regulator [Victivallaceae bacterium]|nr:GntR family transcriptional regulator [Victivallaceae bacterium]
MKVDLYNKQPLKDQVKEYVREKIITGAYRKGAQMPTQRALAKKLHVSNRTVEIALKELEIEGLLLRRMGLGTFVNDASLQQTWSGSKTDTVAVFVPNLKNPIFALFSSEVEKCLLRYGRNMVLCRSQVFRAEEDKYIRLLVKNKIKGIIIYNEMPKLEELCRKNGTPVIKISGRLEPGVMVFLDMYQAGRQVGEYLFSCGHRDIVCAGGFQVPGFDDPRFKGIVDVMRENGIPADNIAISQEKRFVEDYMEAGAEIAEKIIKLKKRPTAIVFYNDARAFGGLQYFTGRGFAIPDDFSVVSFDNVNFCSSCSPPLTSMDLDTERAAELAVESIISGVQTVHKLNTHLVIRKSVRNISSDRL